MRGTVSLAGGYIADSYYPSSLDNFSDRSRTAHSTVSEWRPSESTRAHLDNELYPSSGLAWHSKLRFSYEMSRFLPQGEAGEGRFFRNSPRVGRPFLETVLSRETHVQIRRVRLRLCPPSNSGRTTRRLLSMRRPSAPTPSTKTTFNVAFRSDNFVAAG